MAKRQCGICCIEVRWEDARVSVIPALRTLSAVHQIPEVKGKKVVAVAEAIDTDFYQRRVR